MYTLEQLKSRHSVRSYSTAPLTGSEINAIRASISVINSYLPGTRFQLILDDDTPFRGKLGSYGVFHNVKNYIAAVIDTGINASDQIAGFAGQQVVMAATSAGLGTCYIGGTYDSAHLPVQKRAGEVVRYIISVGHPIEKQRTLAKMMVAFAHRKKMTPEDFFDMRKSVISLPDAIKYYPRMYQMLEAVACSPSALNARPVRIWLDAEYRIHMDTVKTGGFTQVDLGIAQFNAAQIIDCDFDREGNSSVLLPY